MYVGRNHREDVRNVKTEKVLGEAILSLMEHKKFANIRVTDICEEAFVSRGTFYAHYADKYDLLEKKLVPIRPEGVGWERNYEQIERTVNELVYRYKAVITNVFHEADKETLDILNRSVLSTLNLAASKDKDETFDPEYTVLSNFYSGGLIHYLQWQVENRFPPDVRPMNVYLYEILKKYL